MFSSALFLVLLREELAPRLDSAALVVYSLQCCNHATVSKHHKETKQGGLEVARRHHLVSSQREQFEEQPHVSHKIGVREAHKLVYASRRLPGTTSPPMALGWESQAGVECVWVVSCATRS